MKNENKQYHIDVTPEEDALFQELEPKQSSSVSKNKSFWKVFGVVFGLHVAVAAAIGLSTTSNQTTTNNGTVSDNKTVAQPKIATSTPTPTPASAPQPTNNSVSQKKQYTSEYVVKQGDTVTSIARKYKLSVPKLLKINNIKDPNKLTIGQKLKFL